MNFLLLTFLTVFGLGVAMPAAMKGEQNTHLKYICLADNEFSA